MNKFMRLFALLLVVAAIVLIIFAVKLGSHKHPSRVATQTPAIRKTNTPPTVTYSVVTAANALDPGQAITADELAVKKQHTQPAAGAYQSVNEVVGKIPAIAIAKGSELTQSMLVHDLSLRLKPGERAIAVPVTGTTGVADRIHPGDYVDLFFSLKTRGKDGAGQEHTQARLLLPRLRVLAFGSADLPSDTPAPATSSSAKKHAAANERHTPARTAVLAVPVNKVNRLLLVMAGQQGTLSMALRNPSDTGMPDPSLFPQPDPVLIAKAHPKKSTSNDPPGNPDAYSNPASAENKAYAGIALDGLAQGGVSHRSRVKHRVPRVHRIDIIRGTQRGHLTLSN